VLSGLLHAACVIAAAIARVRGARGRPRPQAYRHHPARVLGSSVLGVVCVGLSALAVDSIARWSDMSFGATAGLCSLAILAGLELLRIARAAWCGRLERSEPLSRASTISRPARGDRGPNRPSRLPRGSTRASAS
jgi:hypothetical protein